MMVGGALKSESQAGMLDFMQKVKALLCFLHQCCSVYGPGEVLSHVHPQEFGAADFLTSLKATNKLLGLANMRQDVIVSA